MAYAHDLSTQSRLLDNTVVPDTALSFGLNTYLLALT